MYSEDLTGKRFGRLTVIKSGGKVKKKWMWICKCDCGNEKSICDYSLRKGVTKSCGCLGAENRLKNCKNRNKSILSDNEIIGMKFGKLTVIEYLGKDVHGSKIFKCKCDCGNETVTRKSRLISKTVKSCGCLSSEVWSKMTYKHGYATHKERNRLYDIYTHMINRCHNENNSCYHNYGARGITVCDEWRNDIESFMRWSKDNGYSDKLSLDRIDNSKGYSPDNCRWADGITQGNNKRNNIILEYNGERKTLTQWAELVGIPRTTLASRYYLGWSDERIITEPLHNNGKRVN